MQLFYDFLTVLFVKVELLDFHAKKKDKWEMSSAEKLSEATALKEQGTEAVKAKDFDSALSLYNEVSLYVSCASF
jgi:hypothetical protein